MGTGAIPLPTLLCVTITLCWFKTAVIIPVAANVLVVGDSIATSEIGIVPEFALTALYSDWYPLLAITDVIQVMTARGAFRKLTQVERGRLYWSSGFKDKIRTIMLLGI